MPFFPTPSGAQRLVLAMHSGIIPGRLRGPYEMPETEPRFATCKGSPQLTQVSYTILVLGTHSCSGIYLVERNSVPYAYLLRLAAI